MTFRDILPAQVTVTAGGNMFLGRPPAQIQYHTLMETLGGKVLSDCVRTWIIVPCSHGHDVSFEL